MLNNLRQQNEIQIKPRTNITYMDIERRSMEWNGSVNRMSINVKTLGVVTTTKRKRKNRYYSKQSPISVAKFYLPLCITMQWNGQTMSLHCHYCHLFLSLCT